jgi:hypothetical protein
MNEEIKDPNQLDMFAGILYTTEQEKMIADFIVKQENQSISNEKQNQQYEKLLVDNGFIYGMDYTNTFKREIVTREVTLGYSWDNTRFEVELTYETTTGYIALKGKLFYNNELKDSNFSVDFSGDRVQCSTVQGQYRYVKPKTLLEKLKEYNSSQEHLLEEYKKKNSLIEYTVEKYTKMYPNATIEVKSDWTKYSGSFQVVEVKFKSGSYIQFRVDIHNNKEYLYKKHDAEFEGMSSDELLERFSKQEASN